MPSPTAPHENNPPGLPLPLDNRNNSEDHSLIHWLVLKRRALAGFNAPNDTSDHNYKHLQASTVDEAIEFSSNGGNAQYLPELSNGGLEMMALQKGFVIEHGGGYHAFAEFDQTIGYDNGEETSWIRAELTSGTYHGHPMSESRLPQAVRDHFGL